MQKPMGQHFTSTLLNTDEHSQTNHNFKKYQDQEQGKNKEHYLNRIRFKSFPPWGSETNVIRTPGSTWATHSLGSSSSINTTDSVRPLTDAGVFSPLDSPFNLASISFPHSLGVEIELPPVRRYEQLNFSDTEATSESA